jgi:two-component system, NtrC family, sensor kinase
MKTMSNSSNSPQRPRATLAKIVSFAKKHHIPLIFFCTSGAISSAVIILSAAILFYYAGEQLLFKHYLPHITACVVIITLILLFISSFVLSKRLITRPTARILNGIKRIAIGDMDLKIETSSHDDMGELIRGFNFLKLKIKRNFDTLSEYNIKLEDMVAQRSHALLQAEKMASLGELVAGISHEVNTPIGVCITAVTHLETEGKELKRLFSSDELKKTDFNKYIASFIETLALLHANLQRASELISGFKQIAIDRSTQEKRVFNLKEYIGDIIISLKPKYKKTGYSIELRCPDNIQIASYPGAFSQVITNLIMNSFIHGFEDKSEGSILLDIFQANDYYMIRYSDNGKGIKSDIINKIFDPFFTTKRGKGGTGLGLNIVHNIVLQTLKGTIRCESIENQGTTFLITIPIEDTPDDLRQ